MNDTLIIPNRGTVDFVVLAGSRGYGLETPTSDYDYRGVLTLPTTDFLGLKQPQEIFEGATNDTVFYEVGKFIKLCLAANPSVLELLALPTVPEAPLSEFGLWLRANRRLFFSNRVRKTYGGYARQQFLRLQRRGDFSSDTKKRTEKHARHLLRLLRQGETLLRTGELQVRVEDRDELFEFGRLPIEEMVVKAEEAFERFDAAPSVLPDLPHEAAVELSLINHRIW